MKLFWVLVVLVGGDDDDDIVFIWFIVYCDYGIKWGIESILKI